MGFEFDLPDAQAPYRSLGFLWCPRCCGRMEFVYWGSSSSLDDQMAESECCVCGYVFGKAHDEQVIGPDKRFTTKEFTALSAETVKESIAERRRRWRQEMLSADVRMEIVDSIEPDRQIPFRATPSAPPAREGPFIRYAKGNATDD